jgi:regulatory protein
MADAPITAQWLERYTAWYLDRWPTTTSRLRRVLLRKLRERGGEEALIEAEIDRLVRIGWLNDERFAESRARAQHRRGLSQQRIRSGLLRSGVEREVIDDALAARSESEDPEREAALNWARKRGLGRFRKVPLDPERRKKELGRLVRAGFSFGLAARIVDDPGDTPQDGAFDEE